MLNWRCFGAKPGQPPRRHKAEYSGSGVGGISQGNK